MSYILDALRKAEKLRQATAPDTVTDRILVDSPEASPKSKKWLIALIVSNLAVIAYVAWFFSQNKPNQPSPISVVVERQQAQPLQIEPAKPQLTDEATKLEEIAKNSDLSIASQLQKLQSAPSIAQLYEQKKEALKKAQAQKEIQETPTKKAVTVKKEAAIHKQEISEDRSETSQYLTETPEVLPARIGTPELNDLPFGVRNNLPDLTINVFSYAHQPEDRFVIIDMVKYKTGQMIKGIVKLKEIRPESIVLEYGDETFRIERP